MNENSWAVCTVHGVEYLFQPGKVEKCPSCRASEPALDRASIPAMFNVVGDELRKLGEAVEALRGPKLGDVSGTLRGVDMRLHALTNGVTCVNERLTRIESQLTALRAEADKGRVALHDEHKELQRWIEGINKAVHIPLNRENAERQQRQSEQSLANMKISKICPQCGQPYSASACGPTHAIVWNEMKRRRPARKKKQERKRQGRK